MQAQSTMADVQALSIAGRNDEALALLEALADRGDVDALFNLGDAYWTGFFLKRDPRRGRALFEQAAAAGHPVGRLAQTNLLASGIAGARDWQGALARLREEARIDGRRAAMLGLIGQMALTPDGDPLEPPKGQVVSEAPHVVYFQRLFSPAECDFLRQVAEPTYERQKVYDPGGEDYDDPIRTADGAAMHWLIEDPAIHALNRRIAAASGTGYDQGEPLLILRYAPGQEYRAHLDALPGVANQRIKTALVYLNDDYAGGDTAFLKTGMLVKGRKGDAIVFTNVGADGRPDKMSEHAGTPVTGGVKYLASRWIRAERHIA